MLAQDLVGHALRGGRAGAPPTHAREQQRKILGRPDVGVPLDELSLVPEQAVELGDVVRPETAPEHEVLRRRDGRDRVDLEEAERADGVEDGRRRAVEELRAHGDAARLLRRDDPHSLCSRQRKLLLLARLDRRLVDARVVPVGIARRERRRGDAVHEHREADGDERRREDRALVRKRLLLEEEEREDDGRRAARTEPAEERDGRPARPVPSIEIATGSMRTTVRLSTA